LYHVCATSDQPAEIHTRGECVPIPITPLDEADLPNRERSFWQLTGPGTVMIGLAIGSGEMIL
jgi:hypothetical protein|tara:strand:- start:5872 stop:6060 length:189 start_codon:yes stop_codon:yes gene_type:complete